MIINTTFILSFVALTAFSPAVIAMNEMLRHQIQLTSDFMTSQKKLYASLIGGNEPSSLSSSNHKYTTLEDTKEVNRMFYGNSRDISCIRFIILFLEKNELINYFHRLNKMYPPVNSQWCNWRFVDIVPRKQLLNVPV